MILVTSCRTEPKYQLKVRFDLQILAISEAQILNEHKFPRMFYPLITINFRQVVGNWPHQRHFPAKMAFVNVVAGTHVGFASLQIKRPSFMVIH